MTLLAGLQVLLARYSGQRDFAIGTVMADRPRPELEGLIGFFVNTLVLRTPLAGTPTFRELLARVRTVTLDAYAHQDVPFERIVEELAHARDSAGVPLMQTMLVLQNLALPRAQAGNLRLDSLGTGQSDAKWDLAIYVEEAGDHLTGSAVYRADLFEADTIVRLLDAYRVLLTHAVADADRGVFEIPLVDAKDADESRAAFTRAH